jgi:hypothetical protein
MRPAARGGLAAPAPVRAAAPPARGGAAPPPRRRRVVAAGAPSPGAPPPPPEPEDPDAITRKFGLEAGLWNALTAKRPPVSAPGGADGSDASDAAAGPSRTEQAKQLLARYGSAYLLTSISFAAVSFAACYAAVAAGVDVGALLARLGLQASDTSERVGAFALAYAAHKALSPVRFPPTVALTPVVARWLGKDKGGGVEEGKKG